MSLVTHVNKKLDKTIKLLDPKIKKAIDFAYNRIFKFHLKQRLKLNDVLYKDSLNRKSVNKFYKKITEVKNCKVGTR